MEVIAGWLDVFVGAVEKLFAAPVALSIVLSFAVGLGATQVIKKYILQGFKIGETGYRACLRLMTIVITWIAAFVTYPLENKWVFATAICWMPPLIYQCVGRILLAKFPVLRERLSGRPK